jgi:hypothetical protein
MARAKRAPAFQAPNDEPEILRAEAAPEPTGTPGRRRRRTQSEDVPAYRAGRSHLGAWVNEAAARQFKAMAMERGVQINEAFVEMLNAEFARRGRPTIAD